MPLTLLTLDAWDFVALTRRRCDICSEDISVPHRWTLYFLMAVGVWNFVGAGVFGFLINMPFVSYFEAGTMLTPNHAHASFMGVFGTLAVALMVFAFRQVPPGERWRDTEKYIRVSFWGLNVGRQQSFPGGVLQLYDVLQNGYWHARSAAFGHSAPMNALEWARLPGDLIFIVAGVIPLVIAALKTYFGLYQTSDGRKQDVAGEAARAFLADNAGEYTYGAASPRPRFYARRALIVVLMLDLVMTLAKAGHGYFIGSIAMISDGLHSTLHAAGGIVGLAGIHLAARPADASHPYGYERYELLAAMGIAALMLAAVWGILDDAWTRFHSHEVPRVTGLSFAIIVTSILVTIGLAIWEGRSARALASTVLQADAARIRSDTLVSGSVLAGLLGVRLGFPVVDPLASVLVAAIIGWTASRIVLGASRVLADATVGDLEQIAKVACSVAGVNSCHQVRSRGIGGMVRIDLHNHHQLAEEVERRIRDQVGGVTEVLIHVGAATLHR